MSYLPHEMSCDKVGSIGIAIPGGDLFIIDDKGGRMTTCGTVGELAYSGENVTLGYATSTSDLAKGDERSGLLMTGDMARIDSDGFFWLVGRKNRYLKVFGNRVSLDELEEMLQKQYPGIGLACVGVDDNIIVYLENPIVQRTVLDYISRATGLNRSCFSIRCVSAIARTESGKVDYSVLNRSAQ